jgi:hypothetical protein
MLGPISPPVMPVLFHPALLGVSLVIPIVWIISHPLALPKSSSKTLTIFSITVAVIMDMRVWKKNTPAGRIGTSDLLVHGSPPVETINVWKVL